MDDSLEDENLNERDIYEQCGAYYGGNDFEAWQYCTLAGSEYCDFECPFAREILAKINSQIDE